MNAIKRTFLLFIFFVLTLSGQLFSQMMGQKPVISPEIMQGNKVTFRIYAPETKSVKLSGNWMPGRGTNIELMRNDTGLYQLTIDPLPSEMYTYTFIVDGVKTIDPGNALVVRDGNRNESMFMIPGDKTDLYAVQNVPHGTLEKVWYPSPAIGNDRRMYIYTPAGYPEGKKSYPVLYLLHGAGGDEDAWTTLGRTPYILDNLIANKKAEPMIVVMTNGVPAMAAAPGDQPIIKKEQKVQSSGPGGMASGKFEESLVKDIIPFIEKNYRVVKDKDHRAIAGLSMGGFHTQNISNANPGKFAYIGVMSMGLMNDPRFGSYDKDNHIKQIKALKDSGIRLYWIGCGKDDFLYESVSNLRKFYDEQGLKYTYRESTGGHTWTNWRIYLSELAPQLFK